MLSYVLTKWHYSSVCNEDALKIVLPFAASNDDEARQIVQSHIVHGDHVGVVTGFNKEVIGQAYLIVHKDVTEDGILTHCGMTRFVARNEEVARRRFRDSAKNDSNILYGPTGIVDRGRHKGGDAN